MNIRTPLVTGLIVVGGAVAGAGVASAFDGDSAPADDAPQGVAQVDAQTDGDDERDGRRGGRRGFNGETAAETIGITVDELRAEIQDGSTIAEVAEANGVATATVIDALIVDVEERLDEKVAAGDLTEDEAAEKLASTTERITDRVNGVDDRADDGDA